MQTFWEKMNDMLDAVEQNQTLISGPFCLESVIYL